MSFFLSTSLLPAHKEQTAEDVKPKVLRVVYTPELVVDTTSPRQPARGRQAGRASAPLPYLSRPRDRRVLRHGQPDLRPHGHDLRRGARRVESAESESLAVVVLDDLRGRGFEHQIPHVYGTYVHCTHRETTHAHTLCQTKRKHGVTPTKLTFV